MRPLLAQLTIATVATTVFKNFTSIKLVNNIAKNREHDQDTASNVIQLKLSMRNNKLVISFISRNMHNY